MARKPKRPVKKKAAKKKPARRKVPPAAAKGEESPGPGRPPEYRPQFAQVAAELYKRGATDLEVADALGISKQTLYNWQQTYPEFLDSTHCAKDAADDRVERSLYERAVGYSFDSEKIFNGMGGTVRVPYREHVPPDPKAAFNWLRNRRPDKWRDVKDLGEKTVATLADLIRQATERPQAAAVPAEASADG